MLNPKIEAILDALRTGFFALIAAVLTIGVDVIAKALGFDMTNQLTIIVIALITAVLKAYDRGSHVANKNEGSDVKGLAPF